MPISPQIWKPKPYQIDAAKFFIEKQQCALWLEPGLGKTSIALAAITTLLKHRHIKKIIVLAPLRVCYLVWAQEIAKWWDFNHLTYTLIHGTKKIVALHEDVNIYIINYEGLQWLFDHQHLAPNFDCVIYDEISKLKHYNTKRFKLVKVLFPQIPYKLGLTGTPAANSLMGLFSQTYALDDGKTLGRYITHFRTQYFYQDTFNIHQWDITPEKEKLLYQTIEPMVMRLKAEDYITMPSLVEHKIIVELPKNVRKVYQAMEQTFVADIEQEVITASNAAVKTTKLRQITSGMLYSDKESLEGKKLIAIHDAKLTALQEIIDELQGKPLLIIYEYVHELNRIQEMLGGKIPYLGGGISPKRSKEIQEAWCKNGIPILLGHPQSMGHGLNLQGETQHICFFTLTWDYELYDQTIRRIRRQGCEHSHVFVYHIIAKDTIDEAVLYAIRQKKVGQNRLLDAIKWYTTQK